MTEKKIMNYSFSFQLYIQFYYNKPEEIIDFFCIF